MIIQIEDDFDIGKIAESGQCFRCSQSDGQYRFIIRRTTRGKSLKENEFFRYTAECELFFLRIAIAFII